jgi:hypothetical protein
MSEQTTPEMVRTALQQMRSGRVSDEVFETVVSGAEAFAALETEYLLRSPQTGLYYATHNELLVETMLAARPDARLLVRLAPPYPEWRGDDGQSPDSGADS